MTTQKTSCILELYLPTDSSIKSNYSIDIRLIKEDTNDYLHALAGSAHEDNLEEFTKYLAMILNCLQIDSIKKIWIDKKIDKTKIPTRKEINTYLKKLSAGRLKKISTDTIM